MPDDRALKILLGTYWGKAGWRPRPSVTAEDFAYAKQAGYMFDEVTLSHDEIVEWLLDVRTRIDQKTVSDAFVASLTSRRRDLRSALGSYALASRFPAHRLADSPSETFPSGLTRCQICGASDQPWPHDLNILSFERFKWGGLRHFEPLYAALDLSQFAKADKQNPTQADYGVLARIVDIASTMPPEARPSDLQAALAPLFKSSKNERLAMLHALAHCGIVAADAHPGFFRGFVPVTERREPPRVQLGWLFPINWWRGSDGVNREALAYHFPELAAATRLRH